MPHMQKQRDWDTASNPFASYIGWPGNEYYAKSNGDNSYKERDVCQANCFNIYSIGIYHCLFK